MDRINPFFKILKKSKEKNVAIPPAIENTSYWISSSDIWNFCERITQDLYELASNGLNFLYKQMFDPQPTDDSPEWEDWYNRKLFEKKKAQFDALRRERKKIIDSSYYHDKTIIDSKKNTCSEWYSSSKQQLNTKYSSDKNLFVPEHDWKDPSITPGWKTDSFDHQINNEQLCQRLACNSNGKATLPDFSQASGKACRQEKLTIAELERQIKTSQKNFDYLLDQSQKYWERVFQEQVENCQSPKSQLQLPGPITSPAAAVEELFQIQGIWAIFNFPVNVARGSIYKLSKNTNFPISPLMRLFEVGISILILLIYLYIAMLLGQVLYWGFELAKDSIQHKLNIRKKELDYNLEQRRKDDIANRRKKGRREFGRNLNHILDGPAKKVASIIKTCRGGYQSPLTLLSLPPLPLYALEMDLYTISEWEKEQILFSCHPIHSMIQLEKLRLEIREILKSCKPDDLYEPVRPRTKLKKTVKTISTRLKGPSFRRLQDKVSSTVGILVFTLVILTGTEPTSNCRTYLPSHQIQQSTNRPSFSDLTSQTKLRGVNSQQDIKETEELFELESLIESEKAQSARKKKRNSNKFNRKIHNLEELKKDDSTIKAVYTVQEDQQGRIKVERVEGDHVEELIIEIPSRKSDKINKT